jgi:predicted ArsR family transcriptional regulator
VRSERLRARVLEVLASTPSGLTADEIAAKLDESVLAVRPRVSELFHAGLIEKTGERRRNESGLNAHVWKKTAAGGA